MTSCTANNNGLGVFDKSSKTPQTQTPDNNSIEANSAENTQDSINSTEHNVNPDANGHGKDQPKNVPVPTPLPLSGQKLNEKQQTAMTQSPLPDQSAAKIGNQVPAEVTAAAPATAEEQKPKKTAFFSFGRSKEKTEQTQDPPDSGQSPSSGTLPTANNSASNPSVGTPATNTITPTEKANAGATGSDSSQSTAQSPENRNLPPEHDATSQKKGSLMRLFGRSDNNKENKPVDSETKTALVPLPKKDPHEYNDVLPGVRPNGGIVIKHRTSLYDDTDIDANEIDSPSLYTLASVSMYGRSLPNGLKVARKDVEVSCLRPQLVAILKTIERRFNKPVIITSGYRSPSYNQKVNGAKRSMHMSCAAADIQVPDTNKWEVAKFVRALPNRGGVGTYCHQSIHVDVGPKRDWNWTCSAKN
ncbi:YcbK family protein [Bartonella choladocola]|uniref:YcbK family protein n=1 Tax=Bartonella choladocola TaxID=2750995 RepID=UPI001CEE0372|nr:D-Ala-D-Ala carboxypeptidase family metallohydrolase [Bartonella choladocola]